MVAGFSEPQHYDAVDDGSGGDGYIDQGATCSLNGHNSLPDGHDESECPSNDPTNTVNACSEEQDASGCVSITGESSQSSPVSLWGPSYKM